MMGGNCRDREMMNSDEMMEAKLERVKRWRREWRKTCSPRRVEMRGEPSDLEGGEVLVAKEG